MLLSQPLVLGAPGRAPTLSPKTRSAGQAETPGALQGKAAPGGHKVGARQSQQAAIAWGPARQVGGPAASLSPPDHESRTQRGELRTAQSRRGSTGFELPR